MTMTYSWSSGEIWCRKFWGRELTSRPLTSIVHNAVLADAGPPT